MPPHQNDLRKRTDLPAKQLDDELSALASYNLIKNVKKTLQKNLNMWVLFYEKGEEQKLRFNCPDFQKDRTLDLHEKRGNQEKLSVGKLHEILEILEMRGR